MKNLAYIFTVSIFLFACANESECTKGPEDVMPEGMKGTTKWFDAWEMINRNKFGLYAERAPYILLFDDSLLFTTSPVSGGDSAVEFIGPDLLNQPLDWKQAAHHGTLTIPDGQQVPVGLMSFAASDSTGHPFFVMASPSFWKTAGVESKELGLDNLMTAVFLHEFSHTRQQTGMGAMVDSIEKTHTFKAPELSDDIVQHIFQKDSNYVRSFRAEVDKFYAAASASDKGDVKKLATEALAMLNKRQTTYFTKDKAILKPLDDIFLTMEGLGQYAGFYWLQDTSGANIPFEKAVEGMRRKRNQWSQEEGLAMFLILDRLTKPDWGNDLFGDKPKTIIELLNAAVQ